MNRPLAEAEILEAEAVPPSRYVVVPKLFGHDFAPESPEQRPDLEATQKLRVAVELVHRQMNSGVHDSALPFWIIFLTAIVLVIDAAQLAN